MEEKTYKVIFLANALIEAKVSAVNEHEARKNIGATKPEDMTVLEIRTPSSQLEPVRPPIEVIKPTGKAGAKKAVLMSDTRRPWKAPAPK